MKTIKPLRLSVMNRPYRWEDKDILGVSVLGLVSLGTQPKLFSEQDLWQLASQEIGEGNALDLGVPKRTAEWLVSGYGYTAHQEDKTICAVQARVGDRTKSLTVAGDRYWLDGRITAPLPFERMPLDWAHAFGGPGVAENPQGIGTVDEFVNGVRTRRLPNVEAPDARMAAQGQRVRPSGFGAIPPDWPQRTGMLGSDYGQDWLEHRFPGLAKDADWRYFNAAPPDQHWAGTSEIPPGTSYELWNMHPSEPVLRGNLPQWNVRCFASWNKDGSELQETTMRLTTAWFFPHAERAVLIWHGAFAITQDDAADVKHLMAALELPETPLPMSHYEAVLAKRLDPAQAVHVVRDSDLAPKSILGAWAAEALPDVESRPLVRNVLAGRHREHERQRQQLLRMGLDPVNYLPPMPQPRKLPAFDDLPAYSDTLQEELLGLRPDGHAESAKPPASAAPAAAGRPRFDPDRLREELKDIQAAAEKSRVERAHARGPYVHQRMDADATITRLTKQHELEVRDKSMSPQAARQARDVLEREVERVRQGHRYTAHLQDSVPAASSARSAKLRRRLSQAAPGARQFARMNLAGADLSDMDLRGADFSGANLEDANLSGTCLDGSNLSAAVLARCRLERTTLVDANLAQANLGGARCDGADFSGARLTATNCQKTSLLNCVFAGARFENTDLQDSVWARCDMRGSHWTQVTFRKLRLEDLVLEDAEFRQVAWIECVFIGISFVRARLTSSSFITTNASDGVDFSEASLDVCSFAHGSVMPGAVFRAASLKQCGLRTTHLEAADFRDARLQGCDLSECHLAHARMDRMTGGESLFIRADLTGASMRGADLVDANLAKSDLRFADLAEANLFRADVSMALIDGSTQLGGAYTQNAKTWPARRGKAA